MSGGRACERCEFWAPPAPDNDFGTCKGGPPSVDRAETHWPATHHDDWCGAFRLAERLTGNFDARSRRVSNSG